MYVLPVISANTSFAHDSIYIVLTGGFNTLCDMPANTGFYMVYVSFDRLIQSVMC